MLIRFINSNFLSFNSEKEFNMLSGSFRTHKHHVYKTSKLNILKGAAIYGANGAGKSNFIKSIDYFQALVKYGQIDKSVNSKKFKLDITNKEKPIKFEIEFYYKRKIYGYGFSINGNIIEEEWLCLSGIDKEDKFIFERRTNKSGKSNIKLADKHLKSQKEKLLIELMEENLLKKNELLISKYIELKITDISNVREWITSSLVLIYPLSKFQGLIPSISESDKFSEFANELLETFDTGVKKLGVEEIDFDSFFGRDDEEFKKELLEKISDSESILLQHLDDNILVSMNKGKAVVQKLIAKHTDINGNNINFNLPEESNGTQRLLDFIPAFYGMLHEDLTYVIDEIDQSLHPTLLHALVKKFMDNKNTKGQLIFTTHESNLLDLSIFRQDEIWFAEKDTNGATELYSLSDYNPRYDLDIRKGYLKGRFGAIPFTADLKKLNWEDNYA